MNILKSILKSHDIFSKAKDTTENLKNAIEANTKVKNMIKKKLKKKN